MKDRPRSGLHLFRVPWTIHLWFAALSFLSLQADFIISISTSRETGLILVQFVDEGKPLPICLLKSEATTMFRRLSHTLPADPVFESDLEKLGFCVNDQDRVRGISSPKKKYQYDINRNDRWNQVHKGMFSTKRPDGQDGGKCKWSSLQAKGSLNGLSRLTCLLDRCQQW
jgi:hypothetical protein